MGYLYSVSMILLLIQFVQIKGLRKSYDELEANLEKSEQEMINNPLFTADEEHGKKVVKKMGFYSLMLIVLLQLSFVILSLFIIPGKLFLILGAIYLFFVLRNLKYALDYYTNQKHKPSFKPVKAVSVVYQAVFIVTTLVFLITI